MRKKPAFASLLGIVIVTLILAVLYLCLIRGSGPEAERETGTGDIAGPMMFDLEPERVISSGENIKERIGRIENQMADYEKRLEDLQ